MAKTKRKTCTMSKAPYYSVAYFYYNGEAYGKLSNTITVGNKTFNCVKWKTVSMCYIDPDSEVEIFTNEDYKQSFSKYLYGD